MPHYEFTPDHYHTTIGSHEPVLTISDGDTVATTTVDAAGRDAKGEQVTSGGNPQTGPFYINDARPGDTLAITFDYLMPNRDWGYTAGRIAPNVLEPGLRSGVRRRPGSTDLADRSRQPNSKSERRWRFIGQLETASKSTLGMFWCCSSRRTGDQYRHFLDPWGQYGFQRIHKRGDSVFPGGGGGSALSRRRRPCLARGW